MSFPPWLSNDTVTRRGTLLPVAPWQVDGWLVLTAGLRRTSLKGATTLSWSGWPGWPQNRVRGTWLEQCALGSPARVPPGGQEP